MASSGTGILTATTPAQARRSWPQWAAAGVGLIAVAVAALVWHGAGARLVLGAAGLAGIVRGALLVRAAGTVYLEDRVRLLGAATAALGVAALVVVLLPGPLPGRVLVVGVPVLLLMVSCALAARDGAAARRGGLVLLTWTVVVGGLLVAAAVSGGWAGAARVATVVAALCVAVLGVPLLVGAAGLRAAAARPEPAAPAAPAGCGGCACGAGGCGGALRG